MCVCPCVQEGVLVLDNVRSGIRARAREKYTPHTAVNARIRKNNGHALFKVTASVVRTTCPTTTHDTLFDVLHSSFFAPHGTGIGTTQRLFSAHMSRSEGLRKRKCPLPHVPSIRHALRTRYTVWDAVRTHHPPPTHPRVRFPFRSAPRAARVSPAVRRDTTHAPTRGARTHREKQMSIETPSLPPEGGIGALTHRQVSL